MKERNEKPYGAGYFLSARPAVPAGLALTVFLGVALFFLWAEHKAHIMGALPYALALLCVGMHFLMHGGHGGHGCHGGRHGEDGKP